MKQMIKKRRTMAIISHPDAGKTTLTEKFLLYAGALLEAGSVTARKAARSTTSDWMELEKKRGISVSSTVLQFDYHGYSINLLDTPGHKDFSEDTYRVLTAVDAVIMVIDAAKGIESQTLKLFEVCRMREVPIFTFVNKCDRPGREPLAIIDEIESTLQLNVYPMNWPVGMGRDFKGVYDRRMKQLHIFERVEGGGRQAPPVSVGGIDDEEIRALLPADIYEQVAEEIELLELAGAEFLPEDFMEGITTPMFFGSALNNFGVQLLLDNFVEYGAEPAPRKADNGQLIETDHSKFSAFIFKILANMDPNHRDRIAFARVCSGKFERDMQVVHANSGSKVRLSNTRKMFGQDRQRVDEAYAGDIIGIVGRSEFGIGDTLTNDASILYKQIPRFTPECFMYLRNPNPSNYKKFGKGMDQLLQEGVIQELQTENSVHQTNVRLLAAVGPLQFEVVQYRLESEYGAETRIEPAPWTILRWINPETSEEDLKKMLVPSGCEVARDVQGHSVLLLPAEWTVGFFKEKNPDIDISNLPFDLLHR